MFWNFLAVALGGAIGSCLRYAMSLTFNGSHSVLPLQTLTVNILGSFAIGLLYAYVSNYTVPTVTKMFLFVGLLGGFTTFSTFSHEAFRLFTQGHHLAALLYVAASLFAGVLGVAAGLFLAK